MELWREWGALTSHSHPEEMVPQRSVPWDLACWALLISRQFILKGRWNRIRWPRELPLEHQGGPRWPSPHLPEFHHTRRRCPGDGSWGEAGVSNSPAHSRSRVLATTLPRAWKHLWKPCSRGPSVLSASPNLLCPWVNHRCYLMCLLRSLPWGGGGGIKVSKICWSWMYNLCKFSLCVSPSLFCVSLSEVFFF